MPDSGFIISPTGRVIDASAAVVAGGTIEVYAAGTSTPLTVYSDSGLTASLGTTVYLDSGGHPVSTSGGSTKVLIYTGAALVKLIVKDSAGVTVATYDNVKTTEDTSGLGGGGSGSGIAGVVSKTSDYSILEADDGLWIDGDPTGGEFTLTLPSAATVGDGFAVGVRHAGTTTENAIRVVTVGGQTISLNANSSIAFALTGGGDAAWLVSNGASWRMISHTPRDIIAPMPIVVDDRLQDPPVSPRLGAYYIIFGDPTGAWETYAPHDIVQFNGSAVWTKWTPRSDAGWVAYVKDENLNYQFQGSEWVSWANITEPTATPIETALFDYRVATAAGGTSGGTATANAWATVLINTEVENSIVGCSLISNTINLTAGNYLIRAEKAFVACGNVRMRVKSADGSEVILGQNVLTTSSGNAVVMGRLSPTVTTSYTIEYYASIAGTMGQAASDAEEEIYASIFIMNLTSLQGPQGEPGDVNAIIATDTTTERFLADRFAEVFNVKDFGATGDGVTDDSAEVQAAIDAAEVAGGIVWFPRGSYLCNAPLTITGTAVVLQGAGPPGAASIVTTADIVLLTVGGTRNEINNLLIYRNAMATAATSIIVNLHDAVQCKIDNCWIQGGYHCLLIDGSNTSDIYVTRTIFLYATGTAMVRLVRTGAGIVGAIHFTRCLFNQEYPLVTPSGVPVAGDYKGARANTTAYIAGDIISSGNYYYRCKTGGTSAGSLPVILSSPTTFYNVDITDGTVVWRLMGHTAYRGLLVDTGVTYSVARQCDFTGPFLNAVDVANTDAGTAPSAIQIENCTAHAPITNGLSVTSGREVTIRDFDTNLATNSGSSGISINAGEAVTVDCCKAFGFTYGCAINSDNTLVQGSVLVGNQYGVIVSADVEHFQIVNNNLGSTPSLGANSVAAVSIAAGTSNWYVITGNDMRGAAGGVGDGGTGTSAGTGVNKVIRDNLGFPDQATRTIMPWTTLTLANGVNSNVTLPEGTNFYISGPTGAFSLTGLTAGVEGREILLYNSVAFAMTLTNDATSTAANRFLTLTGADIVTTAQAAFRLVYSGTASRWIQVSNQA